ncbi:MAG TPA: redoxin family protein, partial [Vicinamibacterales bacterium]|nr:redoxin family protein [Vicinamibacterales bacterium]
IPKGLAVDGNIVYVAAGSEGIAIVNAADRANPKVIATADTPGPALRVAYSAGHLFVAAWTDARVYDVKDPADPRFVGAVRLTTDVAYPDAGHPPVTARTKGIAAEGNDVFIGNWWVLYSYRLYGERDAPNLRLPEEVNLLDFGQDEGGDQIVTVDITNQGTAPLAVYDAWTTNPAFEVSPSWLTVAPGARGRLSVTYRPTGTERETSLLHLRTDDPLQPQRSVFLVGNQTGLGIGQKLPTTEITLLDGSEWSSDEASGKVLVLAYFATFCPVCAEHVPELERHFWKKYRDRGVEIVAVDFHDASVESGMKGVQDYVRRFGNTHPVGLESATTPTYAALVRNYRGANPFPVDVVVGRDGLISYISREYDPDGLEAAIEAALGK